MERALFHGIFSLTLRPVKKNSKAPSLKPDRPPLSNPILPPLLLLVGPGAASPPPGLSSSSAQPLLLLASPPPRRPRRSLSFSRPLLLLVGPGAASPPPGLFRTESFKEGLECSVCLTELSDGEEARVLPKCGHEFHLECIDMWLHSHRTCSLCRSPVVSDPSASLPPQDAILVDIPVVAKAGLSSGTGVMGESSRGSCSGARREGMLVIEIPRRGGGGGQSSLESPLPTSRMQDGGEMKTPASGRMRSMRRMLSRGSRGGGDVERGGAGEGSRSVPRTPKDL